MGDSDSEVEFNMNQNRADERDLGGQDGDHRYSASTDRRIERMVVPATRSNAKPDPYRGDDDWDQYISYFEDLSELAQWTDKEKLLYLATCLKGQARTHYCSLPVQERRSYQILVDRLEQRFGNKKQQTRWLSKMQSRTRGKHESIAAFGDEILLYSRKAYINLDTEAQEMLALQHFYKNISPEMRCRLMERDCQTVREAVEIVERYEEVMGESRAMLGTSHARGVLDSKGNPNHNETRGDENISSMIRRIERRLDVLESHVTGQRSARNCFSCGSNKHLYMQCPQNNRRGNDNTKVKANTIRQQENSRPSLQ